MHGILYILYMYYIYLFIYIYSIWYIRIYCAHVKLSQPKRILGLNIFFSLFFLLNGKKTPDPYFYSRGPTNI